jgi:hypothetical protein
VIAQLGVYRLREQRRLRWRTGSSSTGRPRSGGGAVARDGRGCISRNGTNADLAIRWARSLIGIAVATTFSRAAQQSLGRNRIIADPLEVPRRAARPDLRLVVRQEIHNPRAVVRVLAGGMSRRCAMPSCTRFKFVDPPASRGGPAGVSFVDRMAVRELAACGLPAWAHQGTVFFFGR